MTEVESRESIVDQEHLKLLSIGYLVSAGWSAFFSLFGVFYALMGLFMSSFFSHMPVGQLPPGRAEPPPPELFGWIFGLFGLGMFSILMLMAILKFMASRQLKLRRGRSFCMVVGGVSCLGIPWGTMLGVCTFLVLGRPSVKRLFQ